MAGKTIKIFGLPVNVNATEVKEFLERYVEEGSVVAVKLRLPEVGNRSSKAFAVVQFSTSEHAGEISLLAQRRLLIYSSCTLITRSAKHDIVQKLRRPLFTLEVPMLHLGCPISSEEFSVLWSFDSVRVDFGFNLKEIYFFISSEGQSYKLKLSHKSIQEIKLLRCHKNKTFDKEKKFLLIQVKEAPRIYEGPEQNSGAFYEDPRFNYFKDLPDNQWIRTTDFTPLCSIGQSSAFCLQLPNGCTLPNIREHFVCYKEVDGPLHLPRGSSFSRSLDLVPIVEPSSGVELPYRILFKINQMVQNGTLMGPTLDDEFYRLVSPHLKPLDYIERALEDMSYLKSSCLNPANWLYEKYQEFQTSKRDMKSSMISLGSGLVYVHRVQVTPCKVYFYGPEINVSNRVIRYFSEDGDNFMRISFVDEDFEKMRSTDLSPRSGNDKRTSIYKRILSTMRNGICIGDKKFEFLAYSSSQLRENSAWMFASRPGLTAADVREWLGDFRKIRNVAKYAARLGQSFSSSTETLTVYRDEVEVIPDIENSAGYVFSDGIGKISPEFARAVAKKCCIRTSTPSAFQIRYGGYKGVVAVDPRSSMMKLYLRKSMSKYESGINKLDVLAYTKYQPCYLNRQLITLLSTLGVPDAVFERKQRDAVEQLDKMLVDPTNAQEAIEIMAPGETTSILKEMLLCGYKPGAGPFLSILLEAFRATRLLELRTKSRIFIPKGRSLMGCLDETRTLDYGEVFVQVSHTGDKHIYDDGLSKFSGGQHNSRTVVEGRVIVAKNPCLHPGDMRVLLAVDVPDLHHMVDCVVFPQKGKRPHPNECSGSDLDGDTYFVSWDPLLIPPSQDEPMDYLPAKPVILNHDVTIEEVQEYFVNYMLNDSLGIISNAHTVFADREPLKARSEECLQLARLFSTAVDFPKTGVPAVIPPKLYAKEYPDFMEKPDKATYISEGVIGKLFREIKDCTPNPSQIEAFTREAAMQSYETSLFKDEYDIKLRNLMDQYDIKSKAQILSGSVMKASKSSNRYKDTEAIKLAVRHLRKEARGRFNEKHHDGGVSMTSC